MGKRLKKTLIVLLMALCALFVFAGCELGVTLDKAKELRGVEPQVTYYANGGKFNNNNQKKKTTFYFRVGDLAYNYGKSTFSGKAELDRTDYEFIDWYFVEEVIDEENGLCVLGEKVDFTVPLQEGDKWVVAAKWKAKAGLKVVMVCDEGETINGMTVDDQSVAVSYKNGDVIGEIAYDAQKENISEAAADPDNKLFTVNNDTHTFYAYYDDAACTKPTAFPIYPGEEQKTVYAKYLTGEWTFVENSADVTKMFNQLKLGSNKWYWLRKDIDCTGISLESINKMNGQIKGNGYTLKNFTVSGSLNTTNNTFALFRAIGATANITDLTFENVSFNVGFARENVHANVYFVFASKHEDATVSNVKVSGKLTIRGYLSCVVDNIMTENGNVYTNCLYGGYTTDAEYVALSQGKEFQFVGNLEESIQFIFT